MNREYNIYPPPQKPNYNIEFVQSKDIFTNPYMPPLKHNFFVVLFELPFIFNLNIN